MSKKTTENTSETARAKHQRRSDRERRIATLGAQGDPLAGPALQLHKDVCRAEDELEAKRVRLMAVLKGVR